MSIGVSLVSSAVGKFGSSKRTVVRSVGLDKIIPAKLQETPVACTVLQSIMLCSSNRDLKGSQNL